MSGSTPACSEANICAGATDAALNLIGDEEDAVLVAERAKRGEVIGRRHDVSALALNRLDEDGGDVARVELPREEIALDRRLTQNSRTPGYFFPNSQR